MSYAKPLRRNMKLKTCFQCIFELYTWIGNILLTRGGPIIIPVHCVKVMSLSSSKPQLIVPSPTPFCPCSNSSRRRKLRGTTTPEEHTHYQHKITFDFYSYYINNNEIQIILAI